MRKNTLIWCFVILVLVGGFFSLKSFCQYSQVQEELDINGCDYFTGEIIESTEAYFYIIPTSDWQWGEVTKIKISFRQIKEIDSDAWKVGDTIHVAFNSSSIEWENNEAHIGIVFAIYKVQ